MRPALTKVVAASLAALLVGASATTSEAAFRFGGGGFQGGGACGGFGGWHGGGWGWRGGGWYGGGWGPGVWGGLAAGAIIGSALAAPYAYGLATAAATSISRSTVRTASTSAAGS